MNVIGISGSLRKGSFNTAALRAAQGLAPEGMTLEPAERLRAQIAAADAVLLVTPEYNYSISGVLKNAIDWASRPPNQPFEAKPVAIMGASPGLFGSVRAQYHLRQMLIFLNAMPLNRPEVMIGQAQNKFDADGNLTDEPTREFIRKLLVALRDWTERLQKSTP